MTIWALEHISDTQAVVREALRVLKGDGKLILTEVDNDTFGFEPGCGAIAEWWRQFNRCQIDAGGNPYVGQALADAARHDEIRGTPHPPFGEFSPPAALLHA